MDKPLLITFSRSGNTRRVAAQLARPLDAEAEEIRDLIPHTGLIGFLRAGYEALSHRPSPIARSTHDPQNRPLLGIGTPNWAGNAASPVLAWLKRHEGRIGPYAVLVTQGGSGGEKVVDQIEGLIGHPPLARLIVSEPDLASGHDKLMTEDFLHRLHSARTAAE